MERCLVVWCDATPLMHDFPLLYDIAVEKNATVKHYLVGTIALPMGMSHFLGISMIGKWRWWLTCFKGYTMSKFRFKGMIHRCGARTLRGYSW